MPTKTAPRELEYEIDANADPVNVADLDEALAELLLSLIEAEYAEKTIKISRDCTCTPPPT